MNSSGARYAYAVFIRKSLTLPFSALLAVACIGHASETPVVPPALASQVVSGPTAVPLAEVVLAPGDEIRIQVYDSPDLDRTLRVGRDPTNFPLIGDIGSLAGLSPTQVEHLITARLADGFLLRPTVTVTVNEFAPRTVAVLGSVRQAQRITIDPHTTISALQALAQAGGLLDDADRSKIMVLRASTGASSAVEIIPTVLSGGSGSTSDTRLRPGDTVIVPRSDRAYVMGQVARPGPVQIEDDAPMTVARAVSSSGGFLRFARQSKVQLLRDGQTITVDVEAILAGKGQDDTSLKPGDVVFVPESIF